MVKEVSGTAPTGGWVDTTEGRGGGVTTEDQGSRLGNEITGRTDPVASRWKAPPSPADEDCGLTGIVGKNEGTIPPGDPVKEVKPSVKMTLLLKY